ncbi:hypothetical protein XELAEV_18046275mg [Xenopus laevis]|uniref:Uncharacterized protein n=1 Tax=Xenopus laevis TaxID=8355 RepID=A0A974H0F2_XENLA|nr:hypothetical protein XELAEV_18046275mg [Xenopus laevis]
MGTYLWLLHKIVPACWHFNYQAWTLTCGFYLSYVPTCWHGIPSMDTYLWLLLKLWYLPVGIKYQALDTYLWVFLK